MYATAADVCGRHSKRWCRAACFAMLICCGVIAMPAEYTSGIDDHHNGSPIAFFLNEFSELRDIGDLKVGSCAKSNWRVASRCTKTGI